MSSIRVVLGLAASMNLKIEQLNVKIASLHGDLVEEIYMEHPERFTIKGKEYLVCRLNKSLYKILLWKIYYSLAYMDDMLIVGRDIGKIDKLKKELSKCFEMKDLSYMKKVLDKFNTGKAKLVSCPLGSHLKLSSKQSPSSEKEKEEMQKVPYASVVGSLMYVMVCTRHDIAHVLELSAGCTNANMTGDVDSKNSTSEVEYIVITVANKELLWMKKFLQELGLQQERYLLYCDSQSAIHLSKNPTFHSRSKHIDVIYHLDS
ncbi:Retrovirus-related Pol polyprotein from transposon TNT 1-94 [Vitis vinifera]|uniref:Retrovirus-related Pol polyprotein from transposon TNT 1-94 n=1 Tax=Vitis vinifera TaxID=29760 RepID=A0A438D7A9_VITVI|nr:Retrovirus-related Pol polyprotein from transposon TNT 1-94 [Vitis vinifera]